MKLFRYGIAGKEKPGVLIGDTKYDISAFGKDYNEDFFSGDGIKHLKQFVGIWSNELIKLPNHIRLGPPVCRPSKIICIGLNYRDHALETNAPIPAQPIVFLKSQTAICGPYDDLILPKNSKKTDWEVELAVVIGQKTSDVS